MHRDKSLPSWEGDRPADENPGVATTVPQRQMVANLGGTSGSTKHKANLDPERTLTGKAVRRYEMENQWLVLKCQVTQNFNYLIEKFEI